MYRTLPSNTYLKDIEREARDLLHALRRREANATILWLACTNQGLQKHSILLPVSTATAVGED